MSNKIRMIEFTKRANVGKFEHEEMAVSIVIEKDDCPTTEMKKLKKFVNDCLYCEGDFKDLSKVTVYEETSKPVDEKAIAEKAKEAAEKAKEEVKKEEKKVSRAKKEEVKEEPKKEETKKEEVKEEPKKEEVKEEPKKEEVKAEAPKKTKNTPYDRTMDVHKARIREWMDSEFPAWSSGEYLNKFIAASKAMNGKDFLDSEGKILPSFAEEFLKMGKS